jgi:GGDEF domain-containing protein
VRDDPSTPRPGARPVADAPIAELASGVAIAKAWMLAVLAATPLDAAPEVPVADLAREAPGLVAAVLRALTSDAELERLAPGGDLAGLAGRAGTLAGTMGPAQTAAAIDALRACTWHELMAELPAPDARLVADLAERLAQVCSVLAQSALRAEQTGPATTLAVELDDSERLLAAHPGADGEAIIDHVERALAAALGPSDRVVRELPGRYLITAPGRDGAGARALADQVAGAIARAAAPNGAPLKASIGVAVWPDDGADPEALAARAQQGVLAARAAGVPLIG